MIHIHIPTQMTLEGFETPFEQQMDRNNRWVKLSVCIPWDDFAEAYYQSFSAKTGRPAKPARLVEFFDFESLNKASCLLSQSIF